MRGPTSLPPVTPRLVGERGSLRQTAVDHGADGTPNGDGKVEVVDSTVLDRMIHGTPARGRTRRGPAGSRLGSVRRSVAAPRHARVRDDRRRGQPAVRAQHGPWRSRPRVGLDLARADAAAGPRPDSAAASERDGRTGATRGRRRHGDPPRRSRVGSPIRATSSGARAAPSVVGASLAAPGVGTPFGSLSLTGPTTAVITFAPTSPAQVSAAAGGHAEHQRHRAARRHREAEPGRAGNRASEIRCRHRRRRGGTDRPAPDTAPPGRCRNPPMFADNRRSGPDLRRTAARRGRSGFPPHRTLRGKTRAVAASFPKPASPATPPGGRRHDQSRAPEPA